MFLIDRRSIRYFDWLSFFLIIILSGIGLLFIFSATYKEEQPCSIFFKKQLLGVVIGIFIYIASSIADYRTVMRWGYFAYFVVIGLLIFTLIQGSIGMGAQRWINLIFFKLQPSELAKLFFAPFAAYYFYTQKNTFNYSFNDFIPILGILGFSFFLILKQPDLGTALILLCTGLIIIWLAGIPKKFFIYGAIALLITAPLSWHYLKPYQKKRILVFIGYGDTKKERYQIEQSKIAIGSGGLFGKGFLHGTQNKLHFLPESRTDFIFSVIGEEWGFVGTIMILLLYMILFIRLFMLIKNIKFPHIKLLAIGSIIHIILSTIINIGMVIDLLPIVGIPLPLISYGLSNLWITFASLGLFNSIALRRYYVGK